MQLLSFALIFSCALHCSSFVLQFDIGSVMLSETNIDGIDEASLSNVDAVGNCDIWESKGKGAGVKRSRQEMAKALSDVSSLLYSDPPTNLKPIVPVVNMQLGRSSPGVAYTDWLTLLNVDGYIFLDFDGKMEMVEGNRAIRSTKGRCNNNMYGWSCKSPTCPWFVIARNSKDRWYVSEINLLHQDCASIATNSVKILKKKLAPTVHLSTTTAMDIRTAASEAKLGDVASKQSQRLLKLIKDEKRGVWSDGFSFLPSFFENFKKNNPGSIIELETIVVEEPPGSGIFVQRFHRCFVMFHAQAMIASACKPVLSSECGFMKKVQYAKFQVMLHGMSDGEDNNVLTSLAIVNTENKENYVWTYTQMKKHPSRMRKVLEQEHLITVNDRDKGLKAAALQELPQAYARYCSRHLLGNVPGPSFRSVSTKCAVFDEEDDFESSTGTSHASHTISF